jgi:hypothetical protein
MKKAIAIVLALLASGVAGAGSGWFVVVVASNDGPQVAATLRRRADYVAAPVTLRSDESGPAERFGAVASAKSHLASEVAKRDGWILYDGPVFLSGSSSSKLGSFSSSYETRAGSDATLLVPLVESSDVFAIATALVRFVAEQSLPSDVDASVGRIELAVREPQQYRPQLLKLISEDAARTRDSISEGGRMKIEGLEGPVRVRQIDHQDVEMYVAYRLTLEKQ